MRTDDAPYKKNTQESSHRLAATHAIGIDEAGRGCLAGPVVAAAVVLPDNTDIALLLPGMTDSKKLSAAQREKLAPRIREVALGWSLGVSWPQEIDSVNILNATMRAMSRASAPVYQKFPALPLYVDGNHCIRAAAWQTATHIPLPEQEAIINGDALVPCIAAASILAKVFRDRLMVALDKRYPGYGFAVHKGYGTAAHKDAIAVLHPSRMHRKTFRGVRPEETQFSLLG